jgi:hypothetical protein
MSEQDVFDTLRYRIVVDVYGLRRYYNSANQLHRTDGPAVTDTSGNQWWYQNGKRHRIDGAAIVYSGGYMAWFINGEELTEDEFNQAVKDYE